MNNLKKTTLLVIALFFIHVQFMSAVTISGFNPTSGSKKTMVTITGTDFYGTTAVKFNGTDALSFTVINSNVIIAEVPACTSGKISVTQGSTVLSSSDFIFLETITVCSSSPVFNDLIISEVYDANSGSLGFIEIANYTDHSITVRSGGTGTNDRDGGTHYYKIKRSGTISGSAVWYYTFPNLTIASGEVKVGRVGDTSGGSADFNFNNGTSSGTSTGFNDDDRIELWAYYPSQTELDEVQCNTSGTGFSFWRDTDIPESSAPETPYDGTHWSMSNTENSSDLGTYTPDPVNVNSPTITTHPDDNNSCSIDMTVATSAAGTITYQWRYNDGTSASWSDVNSASFPGVTVSGETSTNLTISGSDIADYDGYQFYCVVTKESCSSNSDAAQFTATSHRYFRSKASGNWTNVDSWETATSSGGTYSDACTYPDYLNSDEINIWDGHKITIQDGELITADELTVRIKSRLVLARTARLRINDGAGIVDFAVLGTLEDNSISGNGITFSSSSAKWELGSIWTPSDATIIKTGTSSVNTGYRVNYNGGIENIPASTHWHYRYIGSSDVAVLIGKMTYPNLYFENMGVSGIYDFNHSGSGYSEYMDGGGLPCRIKGNLDIGGEGKGFVRVHNIDKFQLIPVNGDLRIRKGSELWNYNAGGDIGDGFDVQGDVTIEGKTIINKGGVGMLKFSGDNLQVLSGEAEFSLWETLVEKTDERVIFERSHTVVEELTHIGKGILEIAAGKWLTTGVLINEPEDPGCIILKSDAVDQTASLIFKKNDKIPATIERYVVGNQWHYMMASLSEIPKSLYTTEGSYVNENFYFYKESSLDYWNATEVFEDTGWSPLGTTGNLSFYYGYIYNRYQAASRTIVQTGGVMYPESIKFKVSYTDHNGATIGNGCHNDWNYYDGWNLVGNPFSAAFDWEEADLNQSVTDGIEAGIYYYDGAAAKYKYYIKSSGSSTTYDEITGLNANGGSQSVPIGQGFMVKVLNKGTVTSFALPWDGRKHSNQSYWKAPTVIPNLIRLNIEKDGYNDETVLRTLPAETGVTERHDGNFDAYKLFAWDKTKPQLYSISEDNVNIFAINSFPEFTDSKIVPLGVYIGETGTYTVNITKNTFPLDMHVVLEDRDLNVITRLNDVSSYAFKQSVETNDDRFYLHLSKNTAPKINLNLEDQIRPLDEEYEYKLPSDLFTDADFGDKLTYSAKLSDGSDLPEWLEFNPETMSFVGQPERVEVLNIQITATDIFGKSADKSYVLDIRESKLDGLTDQILIYPNPAQDIVTVEVSKALDHASIFIYDAVGKIVAEHTVVSKISELNISSLPQGMYVVRVVQDDFDEFYKLIK